MFLPNLNSVALPVPEIIGGTPKIGETLVPFLENFKWMFVQMDPVNVSAEYEVRYFTRL